MPAAFLRRLVDVGDDQVGRIARIDREVDRPDQPLVRPGRAKRLSGQHRRARLHLDPNDLRTDRSRDEQYCHERSQDHRHLKAAVYSRRSEEKTMLRYPSAPVFVLDWAADHLVPDRRKPAHPRTGAAAGCGQRRRRAGGAALVHRLARGADGLSAPAGDRHRRRRRPGTDLVQGFRACRRRRQSGDDAADQVPHGVAQQVVHRHRHHAIARARVAAPRRSGRRSTCRGSRSRWPKPTIRPSPSKSC